ncbi:DUF481 domain-containing protein [candidate division KSB1 bacterium]|nr:DUF481 domain-containing protein [candidate division KSB1 bacterium]
MEMTDTVKQFRPDAIAISLTIIMIFSMVPPGNAQDTQSDKQSAISTLRIYLDCHFFDRSFFIRSIPFVDFTRDPKLAHVHVLVTLQQTGSGGHRFTLDFIGQDEFEGLNQQLFYISRQSDTESIMRQGLVKVMKMGLLPYVSQTEASSALDIVFYKENQKAEERLGDPWNYWIFQIDFDGDLVSEKSNKELTLSNSIQAERVTEKWKFESFFYYRHDQETYQDDEEEINSTLRNRDLHLELVRSFTPHWSLGMFAGGEHSTYQNLDLRGYFSPAVEYNIFPWRVSNRKVFSIGYYLGFQNNRYIEETLYNKMQENLFYQQLRIQVELIQPWGDLDAGLEFFHYFHNFKYNSIEADFDISYRLTQYFSFYVELRAERIHDQLFLPRGEASREDILLRRRRLQTNYSLGAEMGIRFTFGSIYNTIVNERF